MKKRITILVTLICLLAAPLVTHARSYGFLRESIKEYHANPNPETEARLHIAQRKAIAIDIGIWVIPIILGIYIVVQIKTGRNRTKRTIA